MIEVHHHPQRMYERALLRAAQFAAIEWGTWPEMPPAVVLDFEHERWFMGTEGGNVAIPILDRNEQHDNLAPIVLPARIRHGVAILRDPSASRRRSNENTALVVLVDGCQGTFTGLAIEPYRGEIEVIKSAPDLTGVSFESAWHLLEAPKEATLIAAARLWDVAGWVKPKFGHSESGSPKRLHVFLLDRPIVPSNFWWALQTPERTVVSSPTP